MLMVLEYQLLLYPTYDTLSDIYITKLGWHGQVAGNLSQDTPCGALACLLPRPRHANVDFRCSVCWQGCSWGSG